MARLPILPDRKRPLVFAHRGCSAEAPENTMAAFALARERGIPGIELDIHLCASGELVVIHDYSTGRVGDKDVSVEGSSYATLCGVDLGTKKDARWKGEKPPLLSDLFERFGSAFYYDVEIKSDTSLDIGLEAALARLLDSMRMREHVLVSSFNPMSLRRFKGLCPSVPTGIIYCVADDVPAYLRHGEGALLAGSDYLKPKYVKVRAPVMFARRALGGRPVITWTVDDPAEAKRVLALGCAGVISNAPDKLGILN